MDSTTQIIQRRIKHYKTTIAGIASIVCPIVSLFLPPDWANKILAAGVILSGAGLIGAADAKPKEVVSARLTTVPLFVLALSSLFLAGCISSRLPVVTTSPSGQVTTNYVKQIALDPSVEPIANAVGKPWGLPLGTLAASIGAVIVGLYNRRQLKKHIGEKQ